ncbi:hypothetical protein HGRIS_000270 [Hohenbuehelia grisea]|uniref:F-box domain-containing protein n=1 Tax=Hohenbuehelia grisea TaxID=104357 RepID=A0ABR3JQJ7_9AGAR
MELIPLRQNTVPPIHRVPTEIMVVIFLTCPHLAHRRVMNARQTPWVFPRVCRRWRAIALAVPQLWNHMIVDRAQLTIKFTVTKLTQMTQAAIERSGALPLQIVVALNGASKHSGDGDFCPLLDLLINQRARWQYAHIFIPKSHPAYERLTGITGPLPLLRRLHFETDEELANPPYAAFDGAPLLTNVTLLAGPLPFASSSLPLSRLQRLEAQFVSPYEVCKYLLEAQSLKSLKIRSAIYFMPDVSESEPRPLSLPLLEQFKMTNFDPHVLSHLVIPSLTHLTLVDVSEAWDGCELVTCLMSCISQSSCQLRYLHINDSDISPNQLLDVFRASPSLESFKLEFYRDDCDAMLGASHSDGGSSGGHLLPNLSTFRLKFCSFAPQSLLDFFEARYQCTTCVHLAKARVQTDGDSSPLYEHGTDNYSRLQILIQDHGLEYRDYIDLGSYDTDESGWFTDHL